jgi:hypothetical protein
MGWVKGSRKIFRDFYGYKHTAIVAFTEELPPGPPAPPGPVIVVLDVVAVVAAAAADEMTLVELEVVVVVVVEERVYVLYPILNIS